jgi:hypothetical protein
MFCLRSDIIAQEKLKTFITYDKVIYFNRGITFDFQLALSLQSYLVSLDTVKHEKNSL